MDTEKQNRSTDESSGDLGFFCKPDPGFKSLLPVFIKHRRQAIHDNSMRMICPPGLKYCSLPFPVTYRHRCSFIGAAYLSDYRKMPGYPSEKNYPHIRVLAGFSESYEIQEGVKYRSI
jgi:hypothetical protein